MIIIFLITLCESTEYTDFLTLYEKHRHSMSAQIAQNNKRDLLGIIQLPKTVD